MSDRLRKDDIRLWRDAALGPNGVELLAGRCFGHRYVPHYHPELVIAAFSGGAQRHRIGGRDGLALAGTTLIIPPGETHTAEALFANQGWSHRAFYPDMELVGETARELFAGRSMSSIDWSSSGAGAARSSKRLGMLHKMIESTPQDPLTRQQAFAEALALVLTRFAKFGTSVRPASGERRAIRLAKAYARAHFGEPDLSVDRLAEAAGLSAFHFMRCFRAETGLTAHRYIIQLRLEEARRSLASGEPIAQVAQSCGFADQSHLNRHFRAVLGLTPGRYARSTRMRSVFTSPRLPWDARDRF